MDWGAAVDICFVRIGCSGMKNCENILEQGEK
jgi:hypothetical protein